MYQLGIEEQYLYYPIFFCRLRPYDEKTRSGHGAHVTVISRRVDKQKCAMDRGADDFSVSGDEHAMASAASAFEVIIGAVPVKHDLNPYLALLHVYGTLVLVGQVGAIAEPNTISMILGRRRVAVSLIGSIRETREMLELCGHMKILPECEMINMDEINEALECME